MLVQTEPDMKTTTVEPKSKWFSWSSIKIKKLVFFDIVMMLAVGYYIVKGLNASALVTLGLIAVTKLSVIAHELMEINTKIKD
jgi:hypothetical protein